MKASQFDRVNAFLWSAYADALGFMTELRTEKGVELATGSKCVDGLVNWHRRIGGKYGPTVPMPTGAYSDDTQLRISVCRAIDSSGFFDVEMFAKFELPVWQGYALGAGVGTKAAAANLGKISVNWFSNFFGDRKSRATYIEGGGNGAAMRIQPHVFVAPDLEDWDGICLDVFRNAICTHGHPRGILGALFYALLLARTIKTSEVPEYDDWKETLGFLRNMEGLLNRDSELSAFWVPTWERMAGKSFFEAFDHSLSELEQYLFLFNKIPVINKGSQTEVRKAQYHEYIGLINGFDPSNRGNGLVAASAVAVSSLLFKDLSPDTAAQIYANTLGSDTDTIGTMGLSLLGGLYEHPPSRELQDFEFLRKEAERLDLISRGSPTYSYDYPAVGTWRMPKSIQDLAFSTSDGVFVTGFGRVNEKSEIFIGKAKNIGSWQWFETMQGQSLLVKRRLQLRKGKPSDVLSFIDLTNKRDPEKSKSMDMFSKKQMQSVRTSGAQVNKDISEHKHNKLSNENLDELTSKVIRSGFDSHLIGELLLELIDRDSSIENAVAFAAIIAKARIARRRG